MKYWVIDSFLSQQDLNIAINQKSILQYHENYQGLPKEIFYRIQEIIEEPLSIDSWLTEPSESAPDIISIHNDKKDIRLEDKPEEFFMNNSIFKEPTNYRRAYTGILYLDTAGEGGTLLYDSDKALVKRIEPVLNRLLLFKVTDESWHRPEPSSLAIRRLIFWLHIKKEPI